MSFKLLRYLIADAGVSKYFVVVTIAIFFAGIEALFLQQYFVIVPTIMSRDTLSVDTQATLYRGLIILAALYFGRFILALISSYTQISYIFSYAAYLTDRAARISLVRGIWSKQDDRAKIFISPELVATKCLKASLVIILELITVVALGVIIAIELQILLVIFIAIMCFFLTVVFYIPNIMLKKIGVLRDLADSEMQTRTASILEAPLDYVSADPSKYALNLLSGSIGRKYSAIKKYNFISGVSRYTLEFSFLLSTFATALVAFLYMDLIILEIFIAMSGLIIGGLRIIPSAARMMQAFLDITFGLTALTGILPDRHFDCKNIASSDLANGSNIVGVTINSGKMLDFSEGLLRSISLEKGDLCLITGEIGAGKTLFLKLLSNRGGEDDLSLSINDCELYESDCDDPYYPIYVGATPFLIEGTLAENVYLCPASDISLSQVQRLEKLLLELLLGEADLVHSDNLLQANLSTGNRQIVGLLRAFLSNHPVLLLDEPTSALDPDLEVLVWQMIKRENRERCIFVVTHRAVPIDLSAKRISVKKPGQITLLS